jgi:hypothetical protein
MSKGCYWFTKQKPGMLHTLQFEKLVKKQLKDWGCGSVEENLPRMARPWVPLGEERGGRGQEGRTEFNHLFVKIKEGRECRILKHCHFGKPHYLHH